MWLSATLERWVAAPRSKPFTRLRSIFTLRIRALKWTAFIARRGRAGCESTFKPAESMFSARLLTARVAGNGRAKAKVRKRRQRKRQQRYGMVWNFPENSLVRSEEHTSELQSPM